MRQRILFIILGIVVLLAIYTFFLRPKPKVAQQVAQTKAKAAQQAKKAKTEVTAKTKEVTKKISEPIKSVVKTEAEATIVEAVSDKGKWGTDPFVRDWVISEEISDLKLSAITQSGSKAYALINNQIVEVGEMIAGKKIIAINRDNVVLQQGDRKITLMLGQ
ncbi:MAG: hypothetical protein ABIK31_03880 [candidate division WOR-3 bacterium]